MRPSVGDMPSWYINQPDRREAVGSMYNHAIPSIAICEAYGMSKDPILVKQLNTPLTSSLTHKRRHPVMGLHPEKWFSDTSIVGWNLMALKSAANERSQIQPSNDFEGQGYLTVSRIPMAANMVIANL